MSDTMIVEAGMTLLQAQEAADAAGRLFPLSLASEGSCTIGGNLATNAGGTAVIAFGNARELVNGLEVVLADGRVLSNLSKLKKDNTGYDLKHLFMGSEGTLGIITAAVLKLFPKPGVVETAFVGVETPEAALQLLGRAKAVFGSGLRSFELISRSGLDIVLRHRSELRDPLATPRAWSVLLEVAGQSGERARGPAACAAGNGDGGRRGGRCPLSRPRSSRRGGFWALRELLAEVQKYEGGSIKHDISVPVADVPAFLAEVGPAVLAAMPGARLVPFGHLGDGNLHCNVSQPVGADKAAFLARWSEINALVHAVVVRYGGSISAEHGIGQLKRELLADVQGSGRAGDDARDQARTRPHRHPQSRQGALSKGRLNRTSCPAAAPLVPYPLPCLRAAAPPARPAAAPPDRRWRPCSQDRRPGRTSGSPRPPA